MPRPMIHRRALLGSIPLLSAAMQAEIKPPPPPRISEEQKIAFLRTAKVARMRHASGGITGTLRLTLSDGEITHDASVQAIDESKASFQTMMGTELNFKDSWKFNVAGYRLDRLLGMNMVPVSVERKHNGRSASFTWWVDDVMMLEGERLRKKVQPPDVESWNHQMEMVRVFDQLIYNTDRNVGNLVIDGKWWIWMIDHSRAFRLHRDLKEEKNLARCDRALLEKLKELNEQQLTTAVKDYLTGMEIESLLARRDRIVNHFARKGAAFLYDSTRRKL